MVVHFNDGSGSHYPNTRAECLALIARTYGTTVSELVTEDCGDRELVWLSEEDAADDDGQNAVAEIKEA